MGLTQREDDGLYIPDVKEHSGEKIERHDIYANIFARSMSRRWPQRAYLGLYSGAGLARMPDGRIVETTPLGALRESFTHYIFVDQDPRCVEALRERARPLAAGRPVHVIHDDVNHAVPEIRRKMPSYSRNKGLLSLCFVDPFDASLKHETIAQLSARFRIDFLILLATGMDARRNYRKYREADDSRIAELIGDPAWREEFDHSGNEIISFLMDKFDEAMVKLGYHSAREKDIHPVKIARKNVLLYYLILYSKHPLGQDFWEKTLTAADPQGSLF